MNNLNELSGIDNKAVIDSLTDDQRYNWYLRLKQSLPTLKKLGPTDDLENAILAYEQRHGIS